MSNPLIETKSLTYSYHIGENEDKPVLHGIDLTFEKGTFTAILGHNGSGKSTFVKQLNAILLPSGGKVYVEGMDTADEALTMEIRRRIGMVFQNPDNQLVANVVEEDVAFAPENLGIPTEEIRRRVDAALEEVGMQAYAQHAPNLLSGGQKQRIAIAGVLAMQPECVIFDEPTAMLDPQGRIDVLNIIKEMNRVHGVTVIMITHHMSEAIDADRIVVLNKGLVAMDGTPAEIFSQVEAMEALGLAVPKTTELLYALNQRGFNLPLDALTVECCADVIAREVTGA